MGVIKWTRESIIDFVKNKDYIFIDFVEFKNVNSRIRVKCENDMHKAYTTGFNGFKKGHGCKECQYDLLKYKFSKSHSEVESIFKNEGYTLLSDKYINANNPLEIKCPNGHKTEMTYGNFSAGHRCSKCNGNAKHTLEYIKEYINEYKYELLSDGYVGSNKDIELKCDNGHIYQTRFSRFQQGHRCSICDRSKGEEEIAKILNFYNIEFEPQKQFPDLFGTGMGLLSYDFYLPNFNTLIEYQGAYHDNTAYNQTIEQYVKQQEHDSRKNTYAKAHGIRLLEIWYYDFKNIEKILREEIKTI